jgi:BirA family biotin operon repressor/biotin-[acetyl-CoA-carboxylase] ligase
MKHIHLAQCDSTQDVLKEQLKSTPLETVLVSTNLQLSGRGRGENKWIPTEGGLFFSLNLDPHPVVSFMAIEISVIIAEFFENHGHFLKLKWPNDIWDRDEKKCAGILVQGQNNHYLAGVGINLFSVDDVFGGIFEKVFLVDKRKWSHEIASYIVSNRISNVEVLREKWHHRCGHLNEKVLIREGIESIEGVFRGIGEYGEALVETSEIINKIYNGSLFVSNRRSKLYD